MSAPDRHQDQQQPDQPARETFVPNRGRRPGSASAIAIVGACSSAGSTLIGTATPVMSATLARDGGGVGALGGVLGQHAADQFLDAGRGVGPPRAQRAGRLIGAGVEQGEGRVARERQLPGQHLVQGDAEGEHVARALPRPRGSLPGGM